MKFSLIKILSITIFIAEKQNNKILSILLYDYAKTLLSKNQFILLHILIKCYEKKNIFLSHPFYNIIYYYIANHSTKICKTLLYSH